MYDFTGRTEENKAKVKFLGRVSNRAATGYTRKTHCRSHSVFKNLSIAGLYSHFFVRHINYHGTLGSSEYPSRIIEA
jgi:hypothetical protein